MNLVKELAIYKISEKLFDFIFILYLKKISQPLYEIQI